MELIKAILLFIATFCTIGEIRMLIYSFNNYREKSIGAIWTRTILIPLTLSILYYLS
jgi:hypothetical protein